MPWMRCPLVVFLLLSAASAGESAARSEPPPQAEQQQRRQQLQQQVEKHKAEGQYAEALAAADQLLKLDREAQGAESIPVADSAAQWAELLELTGQWDQACKARQEVLALRRKLHGEKDWRTGSAELELELARKVQSWPEDRRQQFLTALRREQQAHSLRSRGQADKAEPAAREALAAYQELLGQESVPAARTLHLVGRCRIEAKYWKGAEAATAEALAIRRRVLPAGHPDIARSLNNLGNVQSALREYAQARKTLEEALAIRRKALPPDHLDIAQSLSNLGNLQNKLNEHAAAKKSYEEALATQRKALPPDHLDIAESLNNLGIVQSNLREYAQARKSHEEALATQRKALPPDHPDIASSLVNLGRMHCDLREHAAAKKSYEEALAVFRKALPPDHPAIANTLNNLGLAQSYLGEKAAAKKSLEEALAIRRKTRPPDHPDIAWLLNTLGYVQQAQGEYAQARKTLEEALAIRRKTLPPDHPLIASCLSNLGFLQVGLQEYAQARKRHEEALAIWRKAFSPDDPIIAHSLRHLAHLTLYSGEDRQLARGWISESLGIERDHLLRLATAQTEKEQLASALASRSALNLFLSLHLPVGGPDAAAAYSGVVTLKGAVTARQRWFRLSRDTKDPATLTKLQQLRQVNEQLVGMALANPQNQMPVDRTSQVSSLSERRARLERELLERSPAIQQAQKQARVDPDEIRSALPAGTALIDFIDYSHVSPPAQGQTKLSTEKRLVAFVLRQDRIGVAVVELGSSEALAKEIDRWRASHGQGKRPNPGEPDPAEQLRQRLWLKLEPHLKGVTTMLLSPDGPLTRLPFAALPGSKPGSFLIEDYAFATVPVPQLLPELLAADARSADPNPSLLLLGGIDFDAASTPGAAAPASSAVPVDRTFRALPGTETEVSDLRTRFEDSFPEGKVRLLRKDRATKEVFLQEASRHSLVHLATHGFFAEESVPSALSRSAEQRGDFHLAREVSGHHPGVLSGIVFAGVNRPQQKTAGILTALEVADLELRQARLVVLSACDTGRGAVAGGEGVLGLQRSFQLAGARSVLASLWKVDDAATQQLMREFYRNLWEKKLPAAQALRQAQLWMLKEGKPRAMLLDQDRPDPGKPQRTPPYFWAAFVLSGDWR